MKQKLIIIGARAFGRETCNYARDAGFDVVGFLDDKTDALEGFVGYPTILSSAENYAVKPEDHFVCAVGDSKLREKYVGIIAAKGGVFVNVIHPTAYIGPNVKVGVGCIICPQSVVDCDLTLGNHVDINGFAYIPHDCILEDFVTVSPGCKLGGWNYHSSRGICRHWCDDNSKYRNRFLCLSCGRCCCDKKHSIICSSSRRSS